MYDERGNSSIVKKNILTNITFTNQSTIAGKWESITTGALDISIYVTTWPDVVALNCVLSITL